jgi:hypothetical protein
LIDLFQFLSNYCRKYLIHNMHFMLVVNYKHLTWSLNKFQTGLFSFYVGCFPSMWAVRIYWVDCCYFTQMNIMEA